MPIHVTIAINDRVVEHLHIARISGGTDRVRGKDHEYAVLCQKETPTRDEEWDAGATFTHAYGGGLTEIVRKGIEAHQAAQA